MRVSGPALLSNASAFNERGRRAQVQGIVLLPEFHVRRALSATPPGAGLAPHDLVYFSDIVDGSTGATQTGTTCRPSSRALRSNAFTCRSRCRASSTSMLSRRYASPLVISR